MSTNTYYCWECNKEIEQEKMLPDFREPPLDEDQCLCRTCSDNSAGERIQELQEEILSIVQKTLCY